MLLQYLELTMANYVFPLYYFPYYCLTVSMHPKRSPPTRWKDKVQAAYVLKPSQLLVCRPGMVFKLEDRARN